MIRLSHRPIAILSSMLLYFCAATAVEAQDRLALVLEGTAAPKTSEVKSALTTAGYSVVSPGLANRDGIGWAIDIFRRKLDRSGPGSVAIVYVSALAASRNSESYIFASDPELGGAAEIETNGYPMRDLLAAFGGLEQSDIALVLDVCDQGAAAPAFAFSAPLPVTSGVMVADCRAPNSAAAEGTASVASTFAEAILTPNLTLRDIISKTDRGGPARVAVAPGAPVAAAPPTVATTPPASNEVETVQTQDLETVLWSAIKDTEQEAVLEEYLERFPDGEYVEQARQRLAVLNAAKEAASRPQTEETTDDVGGKVASIQPKEQKPRHAPNLSIPELYRSSDGSRFTGAMSGTDATGWGNLYRHDCGADISYRLTMTKNNDTWNAELVRGTDGMTILFAQRDRVREDGIVLLYAASEGAKVTLKVRPGPSGRATYSIPTAGIGSCAVGYLY